MTAKRIAYIGCGAVVERSHLPALSLTEGFEATLLVDVSQARLKRMQNNYPDVHTGSDYQSSLDKFDIAVIATPSVSHFNIGIDLLKAGKHVLMEKPLAINLSEARALCELANQSNLVLAVGLVRRYLPHFRLFRSLLKSSIVGRLQSFEIEEGGVFNWPVQSVDFYNREKSGGGVLMDQGSHLLDICLWWFGDYQQVEYRDDASGGVEADCRLDLTMQSGVRGTLIMSRLRNLENRVSVKGDRGRLSMNFASGEITFEPNDCGLSLVRKMADHMESGVAADNGRVMSTIDLFCFQYQALAAAIDDSQHSPHDLVNATDCLASIALIEQCYAGRQPLLTASW